MDQKNNHRKTDRINYIQVLKLEERATYFYGKTVDISETGIKVYLTHSPGEIVGYRGAFSIQRIEDSQIKTLSKLRVEVRWVENHEDESLIGLAFEENLNLEQFFSAFTRSAEAILQIYPE
ncbi:MAG: PilZ domain-containing protein [SAR324 cluster bacterium]|nr:PilZ domain-containing protein [SAR324 cluster bacterium]